MNNNNIDMTKLMKMLSQMDKKDLEKGLNQLNSVLGSNNKDQIINTLKNNINKQ